MSRLLLILLITTMSLTAELKPLMNTLGEVSYKSDFSEKVQLKKAGWKISQKTRWEIKDGVLWGQQSTAENQASKKDHKGLEPRIAFPAIPKKFIAKLSVKFEKGKAHKIVPFVEFGHHIVRLRFRPDFVDVVADYESMQLAKSVELKWQEGVWYHLMAELKGEEFVIQIQDGPTLYAKHKVFTQSAPSGSDGLGIAGPRGGLVEVDNVTFWESAGENENWSKKKEIFPEYTPIKVREKPVKKK
jgi:hypothetical protein